MNFLISRKVEEFKKNKSGKWAIFTQYLFPLSLFVASNVLHLLEKTINNFTTKLLITSFPKNREFQKLKWISIYAFSKKNTSCSCTKTCRYYGTCCIDAFFNSNVTSVKEYVDIFRNMTKIKNMSKNYLLLISKLIL